MPAKIITIASTKGGTGKSTVTANLVVAAVADGKTVLLVDADPQQSSLTFFHKRETDDFKAMAYDKPDLQNVLSQVRDQFDYIFVDVGGFDGSLLRSAILASDCTLIPVTPSQMDIWATNNIVKVVDIANRAASRKGRPVTARLLLNQVIQNTRICRASIDALRQIAKDIPLLQTFLQRRVAFEESIMYGLGVVEYEPSSKAAVEVQRLYSEITKLAE